MLNEDGDYDWKESKVKSLRGVSPWHIRANIEAASLSLDGLPEEEIMFGS